MWYSRSRLFLFVKEGVYESPERSHHTEFKTLVWTLVDADEAKEGVPSHLAEHGTKTSSYSLPPLPGIDGIAS
jgi:hypothetical protein